MEVIAARYGRSFAEVLLDTSEDLASSVAQELDSWSPMLKGTFLSFLMSPSFELNEKQTGLQKVFEHEGTSPQLRQFIELLLKSGHLALWDTLCLSFHEELQKRKNETVAKVKTAFPLSSAHQIRLKDHLKSLTKKEVLLEITQDSSLIGGIQVEVGGALYDSSIAGYLNRLQQECAV